MKVLMINSVCGIGSTGRICTDLAQEFEKSGHEVKIAYGREEKVPDAFRKYAVRIGSAMDVKLHGLRTRLLDEHGFGSKAATKKFLEWAESYQPDLLWLHNIHGYYINVELLFAWIKKHPKLEVKWTLHDCWAFTGHCAYFTMADCNKWKTHCEHCKQKEKYPTSKGLDNASHNFERKKRAFTGVAHMTLITPSQWLADLVKQSFLSEYPIEVHYNKIDTSVFKPTPSDFRKKYGLEGKKVILGVASTWDERKGLADFLELAKMLDEQYAIVLVGLSKKQIEEMPEKIMGITRTDSPNELAAIYTAADVFVNPSREETFGMTTVEAKACGTKAIVYKDTACEEIARTMAGEVVEPDVRKLYTAITGKLPGGGIRQMRIAKLIGIQRTNNAKQLAEIYTAADYFVNPTYEDNYPTVNLEAKACGTYVITYDTGGCRETIK